MELDWQTLSITLIAICCLLWVAFRVYKSKAVDRDYNCVITGERFGKVQIELQGRTAIAEYDVGTGVNYIINVSSVTWADDKAISQEERLNVIDKFKQWASSRGSSIEFVDDT